MTLQRLYGGEWKPSPPFFGATSSAAPGFTSATTMTSANTNSSIQYIGQVVSEDGAGGNIHKIHFLTGTLTKTNAFTIQVAIEGVSIINASVPGHATGTISGAGNAGFANVADTSLASDTWTTTGVLGADVTVADGDYVAITFRWSSGAAGTGNVFTAKGLTGVSQQNMPYVVQSNDNSTFTAQTIVPNAVLEYSDGRFATVLGGFPLKAINTYSPASGSNPNEYALVFQEPAAGTIGGFWFPNSMTLTAGATVALRNSSAVVQNSCSVTLDGHRHGTSGGRQYVTPLPESDVAINTDFYLSILATVASQQVTLYSFTVNDANHFRLHGGGPNYRFATRNGGAYTITTTERLFCGIKWVKRDDGLAGASGLIVSPGMAGGLV